LQQAFAGFRGGDAEGGAGEQAQAQPLLQPTQRLAEGGLGDAELGRGAGETALPVDGGVWRIEARTVISV
jgi:hypothetical protein